MTSAVIMVAGVSFYISSRNAIITLFAMGAALVFFGGIAAYAGHYTRSQRDEPVAKESRPLLTVVFLLAMAAQLTHAAGLPDAVPILLLVAMGVVAAAEYLRRRQKYS